MWKLFKPSTSGSENSSVNLPTVAEAGAKSPSTVSISAPSPSALDPLPVAEVTEGNLDSDWAMWEDSVSFQDSQIPRSDHHEVRVRVKHKPDALQVSDPFASVHSKSG
jgi:hypothetical protein